MDNDAGMGHLCDFGLNYFTLNANCVPLTQNVSTFSSYTLATAGVGGFSGRKRPKSGRKSHRIFGALLHSGGGKVGFFLLLTT